MDTNPLQVLGLFNGETRDGELYAIRSAKRSACRSFNALTFAFVAMEAKFGDVGMVLFVPAVLTYLLVAAFGRAIDQALRQNM